jgi:hypothetical protein
MGTTLICQCSNVIRISLLYRRPFRDFIHYFTYSSVNILIAVAYKPLKPVGM